MEEVLKGTIRGLINAIIAYWIRNALQSAAATGPAAFFTSPGFVAGAVAAATAVTSALLDFEQGGLAQGPSHAEGGMLAMIGGKPAFEFEGGEAIINRKSTEMFLPELSAINQAGGGVPLAAQGALTLNAIPRTPVNVNPRTEVNTEAITAAIREGMQGVVVDARVAISELDEKLGDYKDYQNRIGN